MSNWINPPSLSRLARTAGLLYLIIIVAGIFAQVFVRESLIVAGDANATAANIAAAEGLFRSGIVSDLIMIIADVAIGVAFYFLLKPVSNVLSLLAAFFRLAQATVLGINLLNLLLALQLVSGASYLTAIGTEQLNAQAFFFLDAHAMGYTLGLMFFACSLLILGYLVYRSGYLPKVLAVLLIFAAAGYLVDGFANFLLPNYDQYAMFFYIAVFAPALIGELTMALYLLIKGVRSQAPARTIGLGAAESTT